MGAGVGILEVAVPPSGGMVAPLEGPVPPAGGLTPSLEPATSGSSPGVRTTPLTRPGLPGCCGCSRATPWVLSATGPLLARTGDGSLVPNEPITVVVFFLGAMAMKNCWANY